MGNIEKKNDNIDNKWLRDKLKSLRDSILGKKDAVESDSVESVSHESAHKAELLKGSVIDTALGNLEMKVDEKAESDEATSETKAKLDQMMGNLGNKEVKHHTTKYHIDRDKQVREGIMESAQLIQDDYENRENEQDPFAKNLLRFANWIMKSEK